ncbi:ATP diphosphatase [Mesorhizobium sp. J18]|nr:ATP diphosphatase [Mesorhizobium sp. J18]
MLIQVQQASLATSGSVIIPMHPSKDISRLLEIMAALRQPKTGCPWDVKQNFASIAPYTIEEAYEVADAIQREDMEDLREELGDLLLQVVFHARMAEEEGSFAFGDVVEAITAKMIRRHPHVFGDKDAREAGMAKGMWEKIKAEEKAERQTKRRNAPEANVASGFLDDIPLALPSLTRALKLQQKAARVGFDWGEARPILDKIEEEIGELREALDRNDDKAAAGEYGDLLFALVNLGRHLKLDPEAALRGTNDKFRHRFHFIERTLADAGKKLEDASLNEMEAIWQQSKKVK